MKNLMKPEIQQLDRAAMQKIMGGLVIDCTDGYLSLMDESGATRDDLKVPLDGDLEIVKLITDKLNAYALVNPNGIKTKLSWNGSNLLHVSI